MRALLLADRSFAMRERDMISRLEVGLADEGVRVWTALPEGSPSRGQHPLTTSVSYADQRGLTTLRGRATALVRRVDPEALEREEDGPRSLDVVHVFGDGAWGMGRLTALMTGATLLLEVWSAESVARASQMGSPGTGRRREGWPTTALLAPDARTHQELGRLAPSLPRRLAAWGVHIADREPVLSSMESAFAVSIVGPGRDPSGCVAALRALSDLKQRFPQMLIFLDAAYVRRRHAVWRDARAMGLLDRLSIVEDMEGRRELILNTDILLHPEATGEHRTALLDAMAAGMAVVAQEDPFVEALQDGRTCVSLAGTTASSWKSAIQRLLDAPDSARALGASAQDYIRRERLASGQVRAALAAYEWGAGAEPLPFADARGRVVSG